MNIAILILLAVFISFRINVACKELTKNSANSLIKEGSEINIPALYRGELSYQNCSKTTIEIELEDGVYREIRRHHSQQDSSYSASGKWKASGDTLFTFKNDGSLNLVFLKKDNRLYWLKDSQKVKKSGSDNWNYLLLNGNALSDL